MIERWNNQVCVQSQWLVQAGIISSVPNYKYYTKCGHIQVVRRGCKDTPALVAFDTMPAKMKEAVIAQIGDPYQVVKHNSLRAQLRPDREAAKYYSEYRLLDGRALPMDNQTEYCANAEILGAIHRVILERKGKRRALGGSTADVWDGLSEAVNAMPDYGHTLPSNPRRLQDRYRTFLRQGYRSLIHRGFCNDNSRKVTAPIERLILALYTLPNKPYTSTVHELYMQFMGKALEVLDTKTGELFNPEDFYDDDNQPVIISESTVWNYINDPKNRAIVDRYRTGKLEFASTHRPHHHRSKPIYSLSKISLDDRDLPRKMADGKRVKAYYAYDVASGCVVGAAYSRTKDTTLFIDCVRDMFRTLRFNGLGIPMEVEVEHHIVSQFRNDLMQAQVVFPFVRWCNPGNSQEKHAEHFNKAKKYGYEKMNQEGIGRFYAKLEANRTVSEKLATADNETYKEATYAYDDLVADDRDIIELYNQDLHPNQKRYAGMSRWEVLMTTVNPNLADYDESILARYIGETVQTSLRRSQYVRVQYEEYQISSPEVMGMLDPNNYTMLACYLPEPDGSIPKVYLFQNDRFICEAHRITKYNTATAEQTEADALAYVEQAKYVSQFDSMMKQGRNELGKVRIHKNKRDYSAIEPERVVIRDKQNGFETKTNEGSEDDFADML